MTPHRIAVVVSLLALGACDGVHEVCILEPRWGVEVTAFDDQGSVVTEGLAGTLTEGAYSEAMSVQGNLLRGALNRAGLYTVTVTATGFEPWIEQDVRARMGRCNVLTERLTAELVPVEGE